MIHSPFMRATLRVLVVATVAAAAGSPRPGWSQMAAASVPPPAPSTVAIYWQPPSAPELAAAARESFAAAVRPLAGKLVDATTTPRTAPPLAPALDLAKEAYARFAFPETIAALDELQRLADARGGGELESRQLSEIFLYRGLARLETAGAEAAWDDLVRAARLDPGRLVDPAQFPPRAVAAFKRAVAEAATVPRVQLTIEAPAGARVRVDGQDTAGQESLAVTLGPHFAAVATDGYEPWAGVVAVAGAREHFTPPLRAHQPPDGDKLLAVAGSPPPTRLLVGALVASVSTAGGWRFVVSDMNLAEGKIVTDSVALRDVPSRYAIAALVRKVSPPPTTTPPPGRRWTYWVVAGGTAVLLAAATAFLVTRDTSSPNVSGSLGSWR
jgi:hypothetical protein